MLGARSELRLRFGRRLPALLPSNWWQHVRRDDAEPQAPLRNFTNVYVYRDREGGYYLASASPNGNEDLRAIALLLSDIWSPRRKVRQMQRRRALQARRREERRERRLSRQPSVVPGATMTLTLSGGVA